MLWLASFERLDPAEVLAEEFYVPVLPLPKALETRIGVSYFTSEKVFDD